VADKLGERAAPGKPLAIALMGPTASGKTALAMALCQRMDCDIISVDSALVYRGMDIGSAKPSAGELAVAPHRLIDIRDPSEAYSAADFCADARREIADIVARGRTPLLVGGTMMYFKALLEGLSPMPSSDADTRLAVEREAAEFGWPHMHGQLQSFDPVSAERIHPNHSQRIARAIEVYRITGKPLSSFHSQPGQGLLEQFQWVQLAMAPRDRQVLHERIALRFDAMIQAGLLNEVQALKGRSDLHADLPAIRAVGYRQAWEHLSGEYSVSEMREKGIVATRQLAKRQLTWLRSWPALEWLYTQNDLGELLSECEITELALKIISKRVI